MTQRDRRVHAGSGDDRSFVALLGPTVVGIALPALGDELGGDSRDLA
jgi:hypothetical protein